MKILDRLVYNYKRKRNIQSPEQAKIIDSEVEAILKIASDESYDEYKRETEYKNRHDGKCPLCGCTKIVNKITRVQGHGEVSGSFRLGYGSIRGSMDIDTNDVNNCNSCGNQWKKYIVDYKSSSKMLAHYLDCIGVHIDGNYSYGDDNFNRFKELKAETIFELINGSHVYKFDMFNSTYYLDLKTLREYFKSVFD